MDSFDDVIVGGLGDSSAIHAMIHACRLCGLATPLAGIFTDSLDAHNRLRKMRDASF